MSFPHYDEYKDSGIEWLGLIPKHWQVDRLKASISSCRNGIWGDEPKDDENDIPCVRVADFDRAKSRVELFDPTIRNVISRERAGRLLARGDLLLEKSGGGESQPVGCVVMYDDDRPAVCSNFVARITSSDGQASSYWRYVHSAAYAIRLTVGSINQTSGIQNLDQDRYFNERAPYPPHSEQIVIASFLDRETAKIDALIEEQRRLIELLKEKRQAVISQAVTKGLDPNVPMKDSGVEWLGEVPAHWNSQRLKALFRQEKRQGFADKEVLSVYREFGVILKDSRTDNFNKTPEDLSSYQLVRVGDLVVNKMKAWQGSLGISGLEGITSPDYVVFAPLHAEESEYLHLLLRSRDMVSTYLSISNGIRLAQWRVEPEAFLAQRVFLPPVDEQRAIAAFVDEQMARWVSLISEAEQGIDLLQQRRSALISAAVTGKIDVRELA